MIWKKKFSGPAGLEVGQSTCLSERNRKGSQRWSQWWREVKNLTLHSVFIPACSVIAFCTSVGLLTVCYELSHLAKLQKKARVFNQSVGLLLVETKTWSASTRCGKTEERWHWLFFFLFFVFLTTFHNFPFQARLSLLPHLLQDTYILLMPPLASSSRYLATSSPLQLQHRPPPPFTKYVFWALCQMGTWDKSQILGKHSIWRAHLARLEF